MRRILAALTAALLATVVTTVVIAEPAHAFGGGCTTVTKSGWNVGVCTSDDGVYMSGDYYINAKPAGASCSLYSEYRRIDYGPIVAGPYPSSPCFLGQHLAVGKYYLRDSPHTYAFYLRVTVWPNGASEPLRFDNSDKPTHCC